MDRRRLRDEERLEDPGPGGRVQADARIGEGEQYMRSCAGAEMRVQMLPAENDPLGLDDERAARGYGGEVKKESGVAQVRDCEQLRSRHPTG